MRFFNIEIKARCHNPKNIRRVLKSNNAIYKGKDHQIDTYFKVNYGRLKLREGKMGNYLIYYSRKGKKGPKQSNFILFKTEPKSPLKLLLTKALGILTVVEKKREIYFIKNVKFNVDYVKNLGSFVEIEVMDDGRTIREKQLLDKCNFYQNFLGISVDDLISGSYSDLLLKKRKLLKRI